MAECRRRGRQDRTMEERCIASFPDTRSGIGVPACPCFRSGRAERQQGFHGGGIALRHWCEPIASRRRQGTPAPARWPAGQPPGRPGDRCRAFSHAGSESARCAGTADGITACRGGKAEEARRDASDTGVEGTPHCGKTHAFDVETRARTGLRYGVIGKIRNRQPSKWRQKPGTSPGSRTFSRFTVLGQEAEDAVLPVYTRRSHAAIGPNHPGSFHRDERLSGCVRCGVCIVALLTKVPTLASSRRLPSIRT